MRKLTFGMNVTLDGYIAVPGDDLGWSGVRGRTRPAPGRFRRHLPNLLRYLTLPMVTPACSRPAPGCARTHRDLARPRNTGCGMIPRVNSLVILGIDGSGKTTQATLLT